MNDKPPMNDTPTNEIRFVNRDGKRILQQKWITQKRGWVPAYGDESMMDWVDTPEWRDVPLVEEKDINLMELMKASRGEVDQETSDEPETLEDVVESIADMCSIYGEERFEFVENLGQRIETAVTNQLMQNVWDEIAQGEK